MSGVPLQRVLSLIATATFVAALVTIGVHGSSTGRTASSSGSTPTTTTAVGSVSPGSAASGGGSPTTTSAPGSHTTGSVPGGHVTSTTAAGPPTTVSHPLPTVAGPAGDPGQAAPAALGHYRYSLTTTDPQNGTTTSTVTETVTTQSNAGGVVRQDDSYSGGPMGPTSEVDEFRPAGLFQISRSFSFNGASSDCVWSPPIQELVTPLTTGKAWTFTSSCVVTVYGQRITVTVTGSARVTGKERVNVGGTPVDVWDIGAMFDATANAGALGTFHIHHTETDRVAAKYGLDVESTSSDTISSSTRSTTGTAHQVLLGIKPS